MVEEKLVEVYKTQIIRTPAHFGIGQEAIATGVCEALDQNDVVYSHHRCHNHYLAQGGNLYLLFAELLGKADGCSEGRGGSVHLTDTESGFIISSAILGQTIAVATGSALALKMDKTSGISVSFFGDAALEEGIFWESLNYASIHKLPVLYVCENNGFSTESRPHVRQPAGTSLFGRVKSFNVKSDLIDGNNVLDVYNAAQSAIQHCRDGKGPVFLECTTYRWLEHVGPYFDHELGRTYRNKNEVNEWIKNDPLKIAQERLNEFSKLPDNFFDNLRQSIDKEIDEEFNKALASDWPKEKDLLKNVY
tara:strand:- start:4811 stop:5728 length:918 start_codon:yes stop_codon:yes gene_type:complete